MKNEFIIWGVAAGATVETILYTKAKTAAAAAAVASLLCKDHGCSKTRVQKIDFSAPVDFAAAVTL